MTGSIISVLLCFSLFPWAKEQALPDQIEIYPKPQAIWVSEQGWPLGQRILIRHTTGTTPVLDRFENVLRDRSSAPLLIERFPAERSIEMEFDTQFYLIKPQEAGKKLREDLENLLGERVWWSLPDEGFLIVNGLFGYQRIVFILAGSERGFNYAIDTYWDWLIDFKERTWVRQGYVMDFPDFPIRGVVEGFSGPQWTNEDRLIVMKAMNRLRMNGYIYAAGEDPAINDRWYEPYPKESLRTLVTLIEAARKENLDFYFSVRPDYTLRYSNDEDFRVLCSKYLAASKAGANRFTLILGDRLSQLEHEPDKMEFDNIATAHAVLANKLYNFLIDLNPESKLILLHPKSNRLSNSPYLSTLGKALNSGIDLFWMGGTDWTGEWDNHQIRAADARRMRLITNKNIYIWDNFPTNEFVRNRLFMGPVKDRSAMLPEVVSGFFSNPMNEPMASLIPLATVADFLWNSEAYDPDESLRGASRIAGGIKSAEDLYFFSQQSSKSFLCPEEAGSLAQEMRQLRQLRAAGKPELFNEYRVLAIWRRYRNLKSDLSSSLSGNRLYVELEPYLELLRIYGEAGPLCVKLLKLTVQEDSSESARDLWSNFLALAEKRNEAARTGRVIAQPVMQELMRDAYASSLQALNVSLPKMESSLEPYMNFTKALAVDGDRATFFWSDRNLVKGDMILLQLPKATVMNKIEILQAEPARLGDFIQKGVLEGSLDGQDWFQIGELSKPEETIRVQPKAVRLLRLRVLADQETRLLLREFRIYSDTPIDVTMEPTKLLGGSLVNMVNGNMLDSCTFLSGIEKGTEIVIDLNQLMSLEAILIYQSGNNFYEDFKIETSEDGQRWKSYSVESGAVTQVRFQPRPVRFIKMLATEDTRTPFQIHESVFREVRQEQENLILKGEK